MVHTDAAEWPYGRSSGPDSKQPACDWQQFCVPQYSRIRIYAWRELENRRNPPRKGKKVWYTSVAFFLSTHTDRARFLPFCQRNESIRNGCRLDYSRLAFEWQPRGGDYMVAASPVGRWNYSYGYTNGVTNLSRLTSLCNFAKDLRKAGGEKHFQLP